MPTKGTAKKAAMTEVEAGRKFVWPDAKGKAKYLAEQPLETFVEAQLQPLLAELRSSGGAMELADLAAKARMPEGVNLTPLREALRRVGCGEWADAKGKKVYFLPMACGAYVRERMPLIGEKLKEAEAPVPLDEIAALAGLPEGVDLGVLSEALLHEGCYPWPQGKRARFWSKSPEEAAEQEVLRIASATALTFKAVETELRNRVKSLSKPQAKEIVEMMRVQGRLKEFRKKALNPRMPEPFLEDLKKLLAELEEAGAKKEALREAVLALLPEDDTGLVLEVLKRREPEAGQHYAVPWLRGDSELARWSKERVDAALLRLRENGRVQLHYHDAPQYLSGPERDGLVRDDQGTYYVGVSWI
jgi:hypothetical protein